MQNIVKKTYYYDDIIITIRGKLSKHFTWYVTEGSWCGLASVAASSYSRLRNHKAQSKPEKPESPNKRTVTK